MGPAETITTNEPESNISPLKPITTPATGNIVGGVFATVAGATAGATLSPQPHIPTRSTELPPRFDEDVDISLVKVVVIGATGVGKTSIIKVRLTTFHIENTVSQCTIGKSFVTSLFFHLALRRQRVPSRAHNNFQEGRVLSLPYIER